MLISFRGSGMPVTGYLAPISSIFFLTFLISCGELSKSDSMAVQEALGDSLVYVSESWDITMFLMEDGRRKVSIRSPYGTSRITDAGTEMTLDGPVQISILDSTGAAHTELYSQSAYYASRRGIFTFLGDVQVETSDQKRLLTEHLIWEQQTRNISSPGFVIMVTPNDSISGMGLTGLEDLSEYTIHEVTGEFTIENS